MALERAERGARTWARGEAPYARLVEAVDGATAGAEVRAAALITRATEDDWRAAAFFLECRDPANLGKRLPVEHEHTDDGAGTFDALLDQC